MIPLIDLSTDRKMRLAIIRSLTDVFDSKNYILGSRLESFEKKFAKFIGARHAIGLANGTDALRMGLRAFDIGAGDNVLTVSFTSPFTTIAIIEEGAIPVFADVDEKTWTMDPEDAERKINKKTKAIMPVHIYGNPCDMAGILKLAKKYKLAVIEDACQAHGAMIGKDKIGTFGDVAAFSFYPTKNLGGIGDGGMAVTNSRKTADLIRLLRHGGQTKRFWHVYRGFNSRLDEIQAAVLEVKLPELNKNNALRSRIASRYRRELGGLPVKFQESFKGAFSANHLFVIRSRKRDALRKFLLDRGVFSDLYYPYPIHMQPAFKKFSKSKLKITEILSRELLALPLFPGLTVKDQSKIITTVGDFFA